MHDKLDAQRRNMQSLAASSVPRLLRKCNVKTSFRVPSNSRHFAQMSPKFCISTKLPFLLQLALVSLRPISQQATLRDTGVLLTILTEITKRESRNFVKNRTKSAAGLLTTA